MQANDNTNRIKIGIYTGISDYTIIPAKLMKIFKPISLSIDLLHDAFGSEDENNIRFNFKDGTDIIFNIKRNKQYINEHIVGMAQFYGQVKTFKPQLQNSVLYQMRFFKEVVFCYFEKNEDKYRNAYIMKGIFDTAQEARGFIVMPNMQIYSPDKRVLFGIDGGSDYEEFTPLNYSEIDNEIDEEKLKNL